MERLTHERVNGIKTGYWSAATKQPLNRLPRAAKPKPRQSWPSVLRAP